MSGFLYDDPLIYALRAGVKGDEYVPLQESHKIIKNKILLNELPVRLNRIQIDGYVELSDLDFEKSLSFNEFLCDYTLGILSFANSEEGKTVTVNYQGRGAALFPASRVYAKVDINGDVAQTLEDITSAASEFTHKGTFDNSSSYKVYNIVNYLGSSYMCILATTGNPPTNEVYWTKIAGFEFSDIYSTAITYNNGDIVINSDGDTIYQSLIDDNLNNLLTDTTTWKVILSVKDVIDTLNNTNSTITNAEEQRVNAENSRVLAENDRETAETARASAEVIRENNESMRQSNESVRQTQETTRESNTSTAIGNMNSAVSSTKLIWKSYVDSYASISIEYPLPEIGWTVQVADTGIRYRWDGSTWQDIGIGEQDTTKIVWIGSTQPDSQKYVWLEVSATSRFTSIYVGDLEPNNKELVWIDTV